MAGVEPLLGRVLAGRFRITGFIGEGAMASVFRGVDLTQQGPAADVAVKVMHQHLGGDPTFTGRFRLEARAAARLSHPNSVHIVDTGEDGRLLYIAMELVQGRDLAEVLTLERRLAPRRASRLLRGVCEALVTAHGQGIVHRDLKPENVMVVETADAPGGELVKVLDFGIAKMMDAPIKQPGDTDSGPVSALTRVGTVVGTPAYMSPEQCRGQPVDGRSDLYTCGVLLYQLITGKLPFWSESPFEIAAKQVREPPPPPGQLVDGLDPDLEQLILRALAKKPEDRFARAEDLRDALAALESQLGEDRLQVRTGPPPGADPLASSVTAQRAVPPATPQPPQPPARTPPPLAPPAGSPLGRVKGGTIPMNGGLDEVVRQINADPARALAMGGSVPPSGPPSFGPSSSAPMAAPAALPATGPLAGAAPAPIAGPLARAREESPTRARSGLVAFMVLASMALGVGAGAAAWFFSR